MIYKVVLVSGIQQRESVFYTHTVFTHTHVRTNIVVCLVAKSMGPMFCSPPGSSVHGISQARMLEWIAISFYFKGLDYFPVHLELFVCLTLFILWSIYLSPYT